MTNKGDKVIVNKNYLKALEQGIPMEHIKMYANAEPGFIKIPADTKLYAEIDTKGPDMSDPRYNVPKEKPKATEEEIEETIVATEIYRQARLAVVRSSFLTPESRTAILMAQGKQVAYGIDKYPEPLNPNTWDIDETVKHIMDESIDRLHYLVMLRIKLEQSLVNGAYNDITEVYKTDSRIASINRMINRAIEEMNYLVTLNIAEDRETGACPNDAMASMSYALNVSAVNGYGKDPCQLISDEQMEKLIKKGTLY